MNLKESIEIIDNNPELNIFIPIQYNLGIMVRKAKTPKSLPLSILEKAPFLDPNGYEVCAHQLSNIKNRSTKGKMKKGIPDTPDTWAEWGIEESDLKAKNYMII